jgi:hypothetical protein
VNDLREEHDENAYDLMGVNSDSVSNDIDEIELEFENNMNKIFEHDQELRCLICCQEIKSIACLMNPE